MAEFATRGVGNTGLGLGIAGTALGLLNNNGSGILGGILGGNCNNPGSMPVTRYDAEKDAQLAQKDAEIGLLKSNTFTDQKSLELYAYINNQLTDIRNELCKQQVHNQRTEDSFAMAQRDLCAVKQELGNAIAMEAERRCCGDNSIVNYANATFYPKLVADVTAGTTTTAQSVYNPLPNCTPCCGK